MDTHRIDIPDYLGGGWVEIKAKDTFADDNTIQGASARMKSGLTQSEIEEAREEGRSSDLMEIDSAARLNAELWVRIVSVAPEIADGATNPREWVEEHLENDLGTWLLEEVRGYYASRARTKSTVGGAE